MADFSRLMWFKTTIILVKMADINQLQPNNLMRVWCNLNH